MKVNELREKLEHALNILDDYDDDQKVKMVTNTYFLGSGCRTFLGLAGYYGGYIDLDNPVDDSEEYDDEEYDDER